MTPAHPPPPTIWNLPFQFSGSHSSISMFESADGFNTAATRHRAGSVCNAGGGPPAPGAAGGVNGPAGNASAAVTVVFGKVSILRLAHADASPAAPPPPAAPSEPTNIKARGLSMNCPPFRAPSVPPPARGAARRAAGVRHRRPLNRCSERPAPPHLHLPGIARQRRLSERWPSDGARPEGVVHRQHVDV